MRQAKISAITEVTPQLIATATLRLDKPGACEGHARGSRCKYVRGRMGPARGLYCQVADYAYAASGPQILILRVSGIKNRLSTKHTAGTAIG